MKEILMRDAAFAKRRCRSNHRHPAIATRVRRRRWRVERPAIAAQLIEQLFHPCQRTRWRTRSVGRDRHQAPQPQSGQPFDRDRERCCRLRCDAALARLAADVHLEQYVERAQRVRPLLGQALRDLQSIDRLHPVELLGDRARLVALDGPDEVPVEREFRCLGLHLGHLLQRFL
jgi:hypothetical protein